MLTIDINNNYFALDTTFSIRISGVNPACQMDKIRSEAGLGINIPVNEINRLLLGAPERFSKYFPAGDPGLKFPGCSIRFGGALLISGSLVVIKATSESYECWLQGNLAVMGEELQNKNITDFAWPVGKDFAHKSFNDDTDDYGVFILHNPGFWEGKGREIEIDIPYIDEWGNSVTKKEQRGVLMQDHLINYNWFINNYPTNLDLESGCVISPYLHLRYVLRESLRLNNWFINRNDMIGENYDTTMFKNIMVYNNYNILQPTTQYLTDTYIKVWQPETNSYSDGETHAVLEVTKWGCVPFDYKTLLPKISYKDFLIGIQNTLNFIFKFRNDGKVDIIDRNKILTGDAIDLTEYQVGTWKMGERRNVSLKFNPQYDKDDSKFSDIEDLTERSANFKASVATKAQLLALVSPSFGELRLVISENKIYEYKWMVVAETDALQKEVQYDVLGWEMVSVGPQPFIYGTMPEREEINSAIGPVQILESDPGDWIPELWQKGNLNVMQSAWKDFSLRLLCGNYTDFPTAMFWEGPDGLFANRWQTWAQFWATRHPFEAEFQFPLNVLIYVNENITSKFRTNDGEFIIDPIDTEFGLNTIGKTTIRGYKV